MFIKIGELGLGFYDFDHNGKERFLHSLRGCHASVD